MVAVPLGAFGLPVHPTAQVGLSIFLALDLIAYMLSGCKLSKGSTVLTP